MSILELKNIRKKFPGVLALDAVDLTLKKSEIHAIIGENGAGKSTLIKIISGVHQPDSGEMFLFDKQINIKSPVFAQKLGISTIHQERELIPTLNAAENLFLVNKPKNFLGLIDWEKLYLSAEKVLNKELGVKIDLKALIRDLSVGDQKLIEIARALMLNPKILILDEPTAALTIKETEELFNVMRKLKNQGVSMLYISHRLEEIREIADKITVLRDGKVVSYYEKGNIPKKQLAQDMVGIEVDQKFPELENKSQNEMILEVNNFSKENKFKDVNFSVKAGEIVGLAGLIGSGKKEVAYSIFGAEKYDTGTIKINGKILKNSHSIRNAKNSGIALIVEDRKIEGLVLSMSVKENISMASHSQISKYGFIKRGEENKKVNKLINDLDIRASSSRQHVLNLSGGNQQKVVLAKWLATKFKVLIMVEPTTGVDVGARAEIYELMKRITQEELGIILVSSDLEEITGMSDKVNVFKKGEIVQTYNKEQISKEKILASST